MGQEERLHELGITPVGSASFEPLDATELSAIESALGARLPPDYRWFLSTFGESDLEAMPEFPLPGGGGVLPGIFFGRRIVDEARTFEERLPHRVVPINDDGGGNLVCLSLRPDSYGAVYFHHHGVGPDEEAADPDQARMDTLVRLAPGFAEFVAELRTEATPPSTLEGYRTSAERRAIHGDPPPDVDGLGVTARLFAGNLNPAAGQSPYALAAWAEQVLAETDDDGRGARGTVSDHRAAGWAHVHWARDDGGRRRVVRVVGGPDAG